MPWKVKKKRVCWGIAREFRVSGVLHMCNMQVKKRHYDPGTFFVRASEYNNNYELCSFEAGKFWHNEHRGVMFWFFLRVAAFGQAGLEKFPIT
jgi:hypothetical protein